MTVAPKSWEPRGEVRVGNRHPEVVFNTWEDEISRKRVIQNGKEPGLSFRALQHLESGEGKASQGNRERRRDMMSLRHLAR